MLDKVKSSWHILIGVGLFILVLLLPDALFAWQSRVALATVSLMIYWWITRPVHIAVTALLPIAVNALFNMTSMGGVLADYFDSVVVLLIGAGIILACWSSSGLDKRIALLGLRLIGTSLKKQLVVWFLISTVMSMFLPNAVVAAALCPIAAALLRFSHADGSDGGDKKPLYLIMLAIVWGAGLGGFGTPLGGAMNLVAINYIEQLTGQEYMYITWTLHMLPYLALLVAGTCAYLLLIRTDTKRLEGSREYFLHEYKSLGKARRAEIIALALFVAALALAFLRPLYEHLLPEFKPFYAFLLMGLLAFFLKGDEGKRLITWDFAVNKLNWSLIILFSGGIAAGNLIITTGAADAVAAALAASGLHNVYIVTLIFIALGLFLANASSNTAAVAVLIPIVISMTTALGLNPLPSVYIISAACNCAYALPTSIRAIPVGYGLGVNFMLKKGLVAATISLFILMAAAVVDIAVLQR